MTAAVTIGEATSVAERILATLGCPPEEASLVAWSLVQADARGLHSHGLLRLPLYAESVEAGGIAVGAEMAWLHEAGATAVLDAAGGFGQVAIRQATDRAAQLAREHGCGVVTVRNSTHFGAGALWAERLARLGQVCLLASTTGPCVAPFGGREPILGTNPITIAVPVEGADPLMLDMATSEAAYGKVVGARDAGEPIPESWAVDAGGRPTTDPAAALQGALRPFGGHKGSGLAIMVEALAGAVAGARFSYEITDIWTDRSSSMGTGHVVFALDVSSLDAGADALERTGELRDRIVGSAAAEDVERVSVPGEIEFERAAVAEQEGLRLPEAVRANVDQLAGRLGVSPLGSRATPRADRRHR